MQFFRASLRQAIESTTVEVEVSQSTVVLCIGMAKVLPIVDLFGYDGQNSSFSSSPSESTPITQNGSHIST